VYPDGPAPYFTVVVASKGKPVQEWERIKEAASKVILTHGATITHHHAVGRDHMPFYVQESDKLFLRSLTAVKRELDPHSIMNPGVLIPSKL
jgi:alkyldihydroxyacetonephosphate synthase